MTRTPNDEIWQNPPDPVTTRDVAVLVAYCLYYLPGGRYNEINENADRIRDLMEEQFASIGGESSIAQLLPHLEPPTVVDAVDNVLRAIVYPHEAHIVAETDYDVYDVRQVFANADDAERYADLLRGASGRGSFDVDVAKYLLQLQIPRYAQLWTKRAILWDLPPGCTWAGNPDRQKWIPLLPDDGEETYTVLDDIDRSVGSLEQWPASRVHVVAERTVTHLTAWLPDARPGVLVPGGVIFHGAARPASPNASGIEVRVVGTDLDAVRSAFVDACGTVAGDLTGIGLTAFEASVLDPAGWNDRTTLFDNEKDTTDD